MKNEMLEKVMACKSPDELKKVLGARRTLTETELAQVSGGRLFFMGQELSSREDLEDVCLNVLKGIENQFGRKITADFISSEFQDQDAVDKYNASGVNGLYNYLCLSFAKNV